MYHDRFPAIICELNIEVRKPNGSPDKIVVIDHNAATFDTPVFRQYSWGNWAELINKLADLMYTLPTVLFQSKQTQSTSLSSVFTCQMVHLLQQIKHNCIAIFSKQNFKAMTH